MVRIGWMRIVAALIDFIIAAVAAGIVQTILLLVLGHGYIGFLLARLVGAAIVMGYFYLEVLKGQAVGKMIFKYQITDQNGGPAAQEALLKRYLIKMSGVIVGVIAAILGIIPILGLLVGLVGMAVGVAVLVMGLMLLRANCLAYWDELCGTAVYGPGTVQVAIPGVQAPTPNPVGSVPPTPPPAA